MESVLCVDIPVLMISCFDTSGKITHMRFRFQDRNGELVTINKPYARLLGGMQVQIASLYEKYSKVLGMFDSEQAAEFTVEECAALIKIMVKNRLKDMEMQSVYFRGCYGSMDYLIKTV